MGSDGRQLRDSLAQVAMAQRGRVGIYEPLNLADSAPHAVAGVRDVAEQG